MKAGAFHAGPNATVQRGQAVAILACIATYSELAATPLTQYATLVALRERIRKQRDALRYWIDREEYN
jgi:hypothetical protein